METATIYARATAPGRAGLTVVRISGSKAHLAVSALTGRPPPAPRRFSLQRLHDRSGEILDEALVVVFSEGSSFTGEESAELHIHGGTAVLAALLRALEDIEGLRQAEPGEFTRRALLSGRLDLSQVEGLADLVDAETEAQRRQAIASMGGALSRKGAEWREQLLRARALLEATIDFSDEEDAPDDVSEDVARIISRLTEEMTRELKGVAAAERIRDGFTIALIGPPNSGKSSLMNKLAGREVAITSMLAGTTRDVIEVRCDFGGIAATVLDTAGIRASADEIEKQGVARARARSEAADIRILVISPDTDAGQSRALMKPGDLIVANKSDTGSCEDGMPISAETGDGLDDLVDILVETLSERVSGAGVASRVRHERALRAALAGLEEAGNQVEGELKAEALRSVTFAVAGLVGRIGLEDILDEIFASFCLGK